MKNKIKALIFCIAILLNSLLLTSCSKQPTWHEPPKIDLDKLPHIEVPTGVPTMEIEEQGELRTFKIIRTVEDLDDIRNDIAEDYRIYDNYILANDIDFRILGEEDRSFRSIEGWFLGIFNGNNYQLHNLKFICERQSVSGALFVNVGDYQGGVGIVKNLILFGNIFAGNWAAAVANYNYGIVDNCINFANVTADNMSLGGIVVSNSESGVITNCINYGQIGILGSGTLAGGIVGSNHGTIENCINYGTILGGSNEGANVGGVAGSTSSSEIRGCTNYGTIIGVNIKKDSGIVGGISSLNKKPYPEKPKNNKNYGSIIIFEE